jgi:hypothetical protein
MSGETVNSGSGLVLFTPVIDLTASGSYDISYAVIQQDSVSATVDNVFEYEIKSNEDVNKILECFTITDKDTAGTADVKVEFANNDKIKSVIKAALDAAVAQTTNTVAGLKGDVVPVVDSDTVESFLNHAVLRDISSNFPDINDVRINGFPGLLERVSSYYSFTLDTDGGADNAVTTFASAANADAVKLLYTQLPTSNVSAYRSASDEELSPLNKLPLVMGDILTLLFNADVTQITVVHNTTIQTDQTVAGIGSDRVYNQHGSKSVSVTNHRIALKLKLTGSGAAGTAF